MGDTKWSRTQADWLHSIGKATDDLGYGIAYLDPSQIEVLALDEPSLRIRIDSMFLSGDLIRRVLVKRESTDASCLNRSGLRTIAATTAVQDATSEAE